jgi:DNA-binding winged helix-turn-helix (wHTH) protein/tetratricopeptide (TPR) repeat protein
MMASSVSCLTFGAFRLDPANDLLLRDGAVVALPPKAVRVLQVLVQRRGEVVEKEALLADVWPDGDIEENNVAQAICAIRTALGDRRRPHRAVQTIAGRGYRFVLPSVATGPARPSPTAPREPARSAAPLTAAPLTAIRLAVRAFRFLGTGTDRGDEGWATALTEAVFTRLAGDPRVRPVMAPHDASIAVQASVQRGSDRLRVSVQLIDLADGVALWGEIFDAQLTDPLDAQDELTQRIVSGVITRVAPRTATGVTPSRLGDRAYLAYLKGRFLLGRRTRAALFEAVRVFSGIAQEPSLAGLAHVGLAEAYTLLGEYDYVPAQQALATARIAAQKALAMGLGGQAHTSLAEARLYCDWDPAGAEREYQRAIALEPQYVTAHHWYGWYLVTQGRFDEGLSELQCAHELDPLSLAVATDLGWALMCAEEYDGAIEHLRHAADMDPTFFLAPYYLGLTHGLQGDAEAAIRELQNAEAIEDNPQVVGQLGFAYASVGRMDQAKRRLRRLEARSPREYVSPYLIALLHAGLEDQDCAFGWFTRAVSERSASLLWPGTKQLQSRFGAGSRLDRLLSDSGLPR